MPSTQTSFREFTAAEYLKIDIATNYGDVDTQFGPVDLDKVDFEERIAWFDKVEADGQLVQMIQSADKPALFYAGLQAYDAMLQGEPIGYPISLDACASGLQLLSVLANCEKSALRCGVIDTGHREDAYMSLFETMQNNAGGIYLSAGRKDLKQAVMTSLYGSKAQPKRIFGEDTPALGLFYDTMETEIPGAWDLNLALKSLWQSYETSHSWSLPDGFEVEMTVEALTTDEVLFLGEVTEVYTKQKEGKAMGLSLSPNIIHSIDGMIVREISRRCSYDTRKVDALRKMCDKALRGKGPRMMGTSRKCDIELRGLWKRFLKTGFLSARVIDLIDSDNIGCVSAAQVKELLGSLPKKSFPVLAIHDCFRIHPNYGNDLRRQYNLILAELAHSDILSDIASQVTGATQRFTKVGNIAHKIADSNYTLS